MAIALTTTKRTSGIFRPIRLGILAAVAATAGVHAFLTFGMAAIATNPAQAASMGGETLIVILAVLFAGNVGGYVVLTTALYLPALRRFQPLVRWALVAFTAVTILAYFGFAQSKALDPFGLSDKAIEAALIALLIVEGRRAR